MVAVMRLMTLGLHGTTTNPELMACSVVGGGVDGVSAWCTTEPDDEQQRRDGLHDPAPVVRAVLLPSTPTMSSFILCLL
jgi:hypothetical protein